MIKTALDMMGRLTFQISISLSTGHNPKNLMWQHKNDRNKQKNGIKRIQATCAKRCNAFSGQIVPCMGYDKNCTPWEDKSF